MRIQIEKASDHYRADCLDLPGTPPVGIGRTPELALAELMHVLLFQWTGGVMSRPWRECIDRNEPIVVNGEVWTWPESCKDEG